MSQHGANSTVTSFDGIDGDLQIVVAPSRSGGASIVLVDCQAAERGSDGVLRHTHSTVRIPFSTARELAAFLDHLDEPQDDRQPRLWSDSVSIEPLHSPVPARRQRQRRAA